MRRENLAIRFLKTVSSRIRFSSDKVADTEPGYTFLWSVFPNKVERTLKYSGYNNIYIYIMFHTLTVYDRC